MLSAAIRARSAFVRRRRPLGPSITSSRETPETVEPSKWTPILPSLSKFQHLRHAHARQGCPHQVSNDRRGTALRLRYDADWFREALEDIGIAACIPARRGRKNPASHDSALYRQRHRIENLFARLKDWRRIATRYDRCADLFLSAICIAATVMFWL